MSANQEFMEQAKERARLADLNELQPLKNPFETALKNFAITDFSEDALQMYIDKAGIDYKNGSDDFYRLLAKWEFIEIDDKGQMRPTGWGILLFGKKPTDKYSQARIKFTVKKGEGDKPEIEDFSDALVKIPEQIEKYLNYVFPTTIDRSHFQHTELKEISLQLLRESMINAIVHRDYEIEGAQILINITPKEIVVKSPGLPIVPLKKLQDFTAPTVSRNPKLADIFYDMKYIERRGFGMEEIQKYKPTPAYSFDGVNTVLTITRNIILSKEEIKKAIEGLKPDERKAYEYIKTQQRTSKSGYVVYAQIKEKTAQRTLKKLVDIGIVTTEGQTRSKEYLIVDADAVNE
jgi:ATP-dependent DNA helicase RecG